MKQTNIFILLFAILTIACGNDPTTNAGYFDDDVDRSVDQSVQDDHSQKNTSIYTNDESSHDDNSITITKIVDSLIIIRDTIHYNTTDTIHIIIKDTVEKKIVDTIIDTVKQTKVDTIIKHKIDTLKQVRIDTVKQTIIDTVYTKIIDTIRISMEEIPRDTTIILYDTTDGIITAKTYKGVVYKDVFYEAHEYQYGLEVKSTYYSTGFTFHIPESYVTVPDKGYENYSTIKGDVYLGYQCGEISKPDYNNRAYKDVKQIKKFDGWRLFNEIDAYEMAQYLNMIVSDTTIVYLSILGYDDRKGGYNATANIAKYKVPSQVSRESDAGKLKYICAYDLKQFQQKF